MNRLGCLTLCLSLGLAMLLPVFFAGVMESSLLQLGIPVDVAFLILVGLFVGSAVNLPIGKVPTRHLVRTDPLAVLGLSGLLPNLETRQRHSVIAVNVGGCLIPLALVVYQVVRLATASAWHGSPAEGAQPPNVHGALIALLIATGLNILVCWKLARPVPGVGIALPGIVPGMVAASSALLLSAEVAPSVTLAAGTLGPLIGGNLFHLRDLKRTPVGLASIGGAGTFDAIVLSLVLAALVG